MSKKTFLVIFYLCFAIQAANSADEVTSTTKTIEHLIPSTEVKLFYVPCATQLPTGNFHEIDLKLVNKTTLQELGSKSEIQQAIKERKNFIFRLKHPISGKSVVLQVTFNAQNPTRSFGVQLPPYTDVRIYGTEKHCSREIEQFALSLFVEPKTSSRNALFSLLGLVATGIIGLAAKEPLLNWWDLRKPVARSKYKEKKAALAEKISALEAQVARLEDEKEALESTMDEKIESVVTKRAAEMTAQKTSNLEADKQNAYSARQLAEERLIAAQRELLDLQRELEVLDRDHKKLQATHTAQQQEVLALRRRQPVSSTTETITDESLPILGGEEESKTTEDIPVEPGSTLTSAYIATLAKEKLLAAGCKKKLVTLSNLATQPIDLTAGLTKWLTSDEILILTYSEIQKDNNAVYIFLLKNSESRFKRFLLLNDWIIPTIDIASQEIVKRQAFLVHDSWNKIVPMLEEDTEKKPTVAAWSMTQTSEDQEFNPLLWRTGSREGFIDGRQVSKILVDLEQLPQTISPELQTMNKFFELGLEAQS
ncbi:hypothetical protein FJ366_01675 [Candidatus Dependentiae bacterium]|nr:hypothetical protein [Candidatus Dependentiae bacterium]